MCSFIYLYTWKYVYLYVYSICIVVICVITRIHLYDICLDDEFIKAFYMCANMCTLVCLRRILHYTVPHTQNLYEYVYINGCICKNYVILCSSFEKVFLGLFNYAMKCVGF